jgi:hypothetical protein
MNEIKAVNTKIKEDSKNEFESKDDNDDPLFNEYNSEQNLDHGSKDDSEPKDKDDVLISPSSLPAHKTVHIVSCPHSQKGCLVT